jgi:CRISPR-associated protein Csm3
VTARVADFHRLEARLRITGTLTTRTALRIGAGSAGVDGVDLPVMKNAAGMPFVPGASLKGALRSTVEALVRGAEQRTNGPWACDPLAENDEPDLPTPHDAPSTQMKKGCGHHRRDQRADVNPETHCTVCQLFGSHVVASHVRFCDALIPPGAPFARSPIEVRDGVSIDRDLRRARDQRKYDFEVVAPGVDLGVEIFVENPQEWLMGLLVMGFDQLDEGFTAVGGFTSRGLGRVSFAWSSIARVTATALLRGEPMTMITGDAVSAQLQRWRAALAARYQGGN